MQLISFGFILFWAIALSAYYMVPKFQWHILLTTSLAFYMLYADRIPVAMFVCAAVLWGFGHVVKVDGKNIFFRSVLLVHIMMLLCFKTSYLGLGLDVAVPVGASFFLLASMGYCIDIHWKRYAPERNFAKLLLFLCFFPSVIQGPINRYDKLHKELFQKHSFQADSILMGIRRFIWGLFKKLILVDRLNAVTREVFGSIESQSGIVIIFAVICFSIELYADFSGYTDMVLGIGQTFGIMIPENFKRPYFSCTVAEFWRRWHISLGTWFRDYVMYGFVMSRSGKRIGREIKKKNKYWGKLVPALMGTMIVWILTGLWHDMSGGYILWGIYYGVIICISLCTEEFWKQKKAKLKFFKTKVYHVVCVARTYLIVLLADLIICAGPGKLGLCLTKIFARGDVFDFQTLLHYIRTIPKTSIILIIFGTIVMLLFSAFQEKYNSAGSAAPKFPAILKWVFWYFMIVSVVLFGTYGVGYDTSTFMYQSF